MSLQERRYAAWREAIESVTCRMCRQISGKPCRTVYRGIRDSTERILPHPSRYWRYMIENNRRSCVSCRYRKVSNRRLLYGGFCLVVCNEGCTHIVCIRCRRVLLRPLKRERLNQHYVRRCPSTVTDADRAMLALRGANA